MIPYLRILHKCHWQIPTNKLLQRFHLRKIYLNATELKQQVEAILDSAYHVFKEKANIMKDLDQAVAAQAFEDRAKK